MAMSLTEPGAVVPILELEPRAPELLDGLERLHPQQLLLDRADESFGDAEGPTGCDRGGWCAGPGTYTATPHHKASLRGKRYGVQEALPCERHAIPLGLTKLPPEAI